MPTARSGPQRSMLVLPGGGYERRSDHEGKPVADWLTTLGWRARVVPYPVRTRHPGPLTMLREEIATERRDGADVVGVLGFSAGGHLAGLAALAPSEVPGTTAGRPDVVVLGYPVVSMVTPTHGGSRRNLLGDDASDDARRAASLELLVTTDAPPFFCWHTVEDASVPVAEHTYPLAAALAGAGVPHEVHTFPGDFHGLGLAIGEPAGAWTGLCAAWLDRVAPGGGVGGPPQGISDPSLRRGARG